MKIISFSEGQSGEDWHLWRKNGIGASDVSVISGSNPYKTPLQLWEEKCGYRKGDELNVAMKHGIRNEDVARQWINENFQLHLKPVCVEDPQISHFRASLDGFDFDQKVLVEIKCPISESVLDKARTQQAIPDYWFDQMQWQIMLTNPQRAFIALWDYRCSACITLDMFGHVNQIKALREKAGDFWHRVQIGKAPEPTTKDYISIEDPRLEALLLEYQDLTQREKSLTERRKEVKKQIEDFGDDGNFMAYGFKVQRVAAAPRYDIEQMRLDGIDVEKYKKVTDSIGWYRINCPKRK